MLLLRIIRISCCSSGPILYRSQTKRIKLDVYGSRHYSTGTLEPIGRRRKKIAWVATGGVLTSLVAFGLISEGPSHAFNAMARTARVATALGLCINDYSKTLRKAEGHEDRQAMLNACHQRCADRTFEVLEKNGSIFIKLGQHLSSMSYLLPLEWTTTFTPLQDKCPVSSIESIKKLILDDTGFTCDELFTEFDPTPIGAASLAQVHRAVLRETGQEVAVKLQHPALAEWVPLDIGLTRFAFTNIKFFFPEYPMEWLSQEMEESLPQELDFEQEAANVNRVREYFSNIKGTPLVVPAVMWAKKRILVLEFIQGHRLDDLEYLDRSGISREAVSTSLAHIFNEMIFGTNAPLHCDPHGGNLAIRYNPYRRPNFDIILYDHGLYRDIPQNMRRSYAKLWLAVIDGNEVNMRKYAYEVANITDEQFPLFASAITGRDYTVVKESVSAPRSEAEKEQISAALSDGLLAQLIQLLSQVPKIILLILKTNDLTRSLDESLETGTGPERTFLILARYCSRTVFEEQVEQIGAMTDHSRFERAFSYMAAYIYYYRTDLKLRLYEWYLRVSAMFVAPKPIEGLPPRISQPFEK